MADKKEEKAAAAEKPKVEFVTVKSKLAKNATGGEPVALSEVHPDHPGGEVFVYGDKPVKVARTAAVSLALAQGKLEEV